MTRQKIRKQMLCVFIVLMAISCNQTSKTEKSSDSQGLTPKAGGLVTFHLNEPPSSVEPLMLSQLADSVSYVALETRDETLTNDAVLYGDRYYTFVHGVLICFDSKGKFLHQIGKSGPGPEEYAIRSGSMSLINVDPTDNYVYCTSSDLRTKVYDENGKFVKSLEGEIFKYGFSFCCNHLAYDIRGYFPDRYNQKYSVFVIVDTRTGKELMRKTVDPIAKVSKEVGSNIPAGFMGLAASSFTRDAFYHWTVFQDTMFKAHDGNVTPYCLIIPKNKYKAENLFVNQDEAAQRQPLIRTLFVLSSKLLLEVLYIPSAGQGRSYWVLCDMKDGSVTYYDDYIVNDLDGGPNIKRSRNIYCLSAEDFKNDEDIYDSYFTKGVKAKLKDQDGKFQRLLKTLEDDANPIMRMIHWK